MVDNPQSGGMGNQKAGNPGSMQQPSPMDMGYAQPLNPQGGGSENTGGFLSSSPMLSSDTSGSTMGATNAPRPMGSGKAGNPGSMQQPSPMDMGYAQPFNPMGMQPTGNARPPGAPQAPMYNNPAPPMPQPSAPTMLPDRGPPGPGGYARSGFGQPDYSAMPPDQQPEQRGFGGFPGPFGGNPFGGGGSPFDMFARMRGMGGGAPDDSNVRDSIDSGNRMMGNPQQMQQRVQRQMQEMQQRAQQSRPSNQQAAPTLTPAPAVQQYAPETIQQYKARVGMASGGLASISPRNR